MNEFKIGDTVTVVKTKWVGTIVFFDKKREKYLVRISGTQQMYYGADELKKI